MSAPAPVGSQATPNIWIVPEKGRSVRSSVAASQRRTVERLPTMMAEDPSDFQSRSNSPSSRPVSICSTAVPVHLSSIPPLPTMSP